MALIDCPECGKKISESTSSCPHCGYKLSADAVSIELPPPTEIGNPEKSLGLGWPLAILGGVGVAVSIFVFILSFITGLVVFIGSFGLLSVGLRKIQGERLIRCPYCGNLSREGKSFTSYKCPTCKKRSIRDGNYLKPIP